MKTLFNTIPIDRFGTADEVAKAVVFLASDDSLYVTGTELFVDGGFAQCRELGRNRILFHRNRFSRSTVAEERIIWLR